MGIDDDSKALEGRIEALTAELEELKKALPAHGLQPRHLQRIEELEEEIEAATPALAELKD